MKIDYLEFKHICNIKPKAATDGSILCLMPQNRYANSKSLALNNYGNGPFCKFSIPNHFKTSGVYALVVGDSVKYIGECISLSSRYNQGYGNISPRNCFKGGQETNCRINNLILREIENGLEVKLWFHECRDHKLHEKHLLTLGSYEWNR